MGPGGRIAVLIVGRGVGGLARSCQFGLASAPIGLHTVQAMRRPNDGTVHRSSRTIQQAIQNPFLRSPPRKQPPYRSLHWILLTGSALVGRGCVSVGGRSPLASA